MPPSSRTTSAHVPVEVEVGVVLPHPVALALDGDLGQDPVLADHALHDQFGEGREVGELVEADQPVDVHEVVRPVHQEPCDIFVRDLRAQRPSSENRGDDPDSWPVRQTDPHVTDPRQNASIP